MCAWPHGEVYGLDALWFWIGIEYERRFDVTKCRWPEEAARKQAHRQYLIKEIEAEVVAMGDAAQDVQGKRVAALRSSHRFGKYLKLGDMGLELDHKAIKAAEHDDGKIVVHGNDDTLSAQDMALGYKPLLRVEQAWRDMKSTLDMRPVFHSAPHRIHAHVAITVLALLPARTAEHACADTWRNIGDPLRRIQLAPIIVTWHAPAQANYEFKRFHEAAKRRGFLRYPGKLTQLDTFRVGCIGVIGRSEMQRAVNAAGEALREMVALR